MKNIRTTFSLIVLLLFVSGSGCDLIQSGNGENIQASGVVESKEIVIAPEVDGRVAEVWLSEGDKVTMGDPLFRIEDELLESQLRQAESTLEIAQANYDLVAAGATSEQQQAAISTAELELANAVYALDLLYDEHDLLTAQTLQAKKEAEDALEDLTNPELQQALAQEAIAVAEKSVESSKRNL
jgi:multidrug resistance efflux pump